MTQNVCRKQTKPFMELRYTITNYEMYYSDQTRHTQLRFELCLQHTEHDHIYYIRCLFIRIGVSTQSIKRIPTWLTGGHRTRTITANRMLMIIRYGQTTTHHPYTCRRVPRFGFDNIIWRCLCLSRPSV